MTIGAVVATSFRISWDLINHGFKSYSLTHPWQVFYNAREKLKCLYSFATTVNRTIIKAGDTRTIDKLVMLRSR